MKPALLLLAFAALAVFAAEKQPEPKPEPPKAESKALTREQQLVLENLNLRRQIIDRDQNDFVNEVCKGAGFPVAECAITPTPEGLRIVHRPAPKVEAAKPAK